MTNSEVTSNLSQLPLGYQLMYSGDKLVARWKAGKVGVEAVEPVLRFMEEHADEDFGAPGSLTHFVEQFYGRGYEEKLADSVRRKPTNQTITMLARVIAGAKDGHERQYYIDLMKQSHNHPSADGLLKELIDHYLET